MAYTIVGLGNPGEEYIQTRHNTGRIVLDFFREQNGDVQFKEQSGAKSLVVKCKIDGESVTLVEPNNFMNRSGPCVAYFVKPPASKEKALKLVVIHDDLDLALGTIKISSNRGPGGHRGVLSIIKALKTENFIRIRIGISPSLRGKIKKPAGAAIEKHILGVFSKPELATLKKVSKTVSEALAVIIKDGVSKAMGEFN